MQDVKEYIEKVMDEQKYLNRLLIQNKTIDELLVDIETWLDNSNEPHMNFPQNSMVKLQLAYQTSFFDPPKIHAIEHQLYRRAMECLQTVIRLCIFYAYNHFPQENDLLQRITFNLAAYKNLNRTAMESVFLTNKILFKHVFTNEKIEELFC